MFHAHRRLVPALLPILGLAFVAAVADKHPSETALLMGKTIPWAALPMPETLYRQDELRTRWAAVEQDVALKTETEKTRQAAEPYVAMGAERWVELIPNRSPLPSATGGGCPFTGAIYTWGVWDTRSLDLASRPFQLKSRFSDIWLFEREEDRPEDYPLKTAGHETIPYWDGRTEQLAYVYTVGKTDGPRYYPANIVWEERLRKIAQEALPALREAYLATGDDVYAQPIVVILKRFADIFPAFPQGTRQKISERTREFFLPEPRRQVYLNQRMWQYPCRLLQHYGVIGDAQVAHQMAMSYLAIEHSRAWGDDPGEAAALKEHIRKNLFEELALTFTAVDTRCGNHIGGYVTALLALGIALRDEFLVGRYNQVMTEFLYSHHFYDGISTEGSVLYSYMMNSMVRKWRDEFAPLYPEQAQQHPFFGDIGKTASRMSTLLNRESAHNDGFDGVFGARFSMRSGLDDEGHELREPSEAFPGFGLTILRAGGPDRRLEIILSHDRAVGHDHDDPLGLQVFYRGVPIINHLRYCVPGRSLDLDVNRNPLAAEILKIPFPAPLRVYSEAPRSKEFPAFRAFAASPLTKNTVSIDEYAVQPYTGHYRDGASPFGNLEFIRLSAEADGPEAGFEVVEASMANMLRGTPTRVNDFRRALVAVTRADGQPYVVDVTWVSGGSRHLMLWHSHGSETASTLPDGNGPFATLSDWLDTWVPERQDPARFAWYRVPSEEQFMRQVRPIGQDQMPDVWQHTWQLDWLAWAGGSSGVPDWAPERITPVSITLHGLRPDTFESEVLGVRAISDYYATFTNAPIAGQRLSGTVTFENALRYVGQMHHGGGELYSAFVHVLEPFADGEQPFIRSIERLTPEVNPFPFIKGVAALRLTFADGTCDLVVAMPEERRLGFEDGPVVEGRFALVRLDRNGSVMQARLIGGTRLAYGGESLIEQNTGFFHGDLVRLEGDLSGDRSRSALLVRPTVPWPDGQALVGRTALVRYRSGRTEGYRVQTIEPAGGAELRLVLQGHPPFVDLWGEVYDVPEKNMFLGPNKNPNAAIPYLDHSRVVFPTLGLELPFARLGWHDWGISKHHIDADVDLVRLGVKPGMAYAIIPDIRHASVSISADWPWRPVP